MEANGKGLKELWHRSERIAFFLASRELPLFRISHVLIVFASGVHGACQSPVTAQTATLLSPNESVEVKLDVSEHVGGQVLSFRVYFEGQQIMDKSSITFRMADDSMLGTRLENLSMGEVTSQRGSWEPTYGERSVVRNDYNQLIVRARDENASGELAYIFRCYDAGLAFSTQILKLGDASSITIADEYSEFQFTGDHEAWHSATAQGPLSKTRLSGVSEVVERPFLVRMEGDLYVAIGEAKLVDYAQLKLRRDERSDFGMVSQLCSAVTGTLPCQTPWRVVMVARSAGDLLENNDLFLNLNEPCALADTSWIRPGKVLRDMTFKTEGAKDCIDFAAENGLQFVEFDAGWYGNQYDESSDATTVTPDPAGPFGPLDLPDVLRYANERGIGIILYVNRRALESQADEIFPLYREWGIAGVKFGFVNTGPQEWTSWLHDEIRNAADNQLMVDVHDEYRPTGYSRTYPNLMTQEGVRGDEETPSGEHTLTTLFTRYVAGAGDFTICYFNKRVAENWTHAHQLGKAVCFYSPWHFVFWYDTPPGKEENSGTIRRVPELEFFRHLPTTWDDTKVLHGVIGEYAAIARRSGEDWYIGALNNDVPRTLALPLTFLEPGKLYTAHLYTDDPTLDTLTCVKIEQLTVNQSAQLTVRLEANGGAAVRLVPETD